MQSEVTIGDQRPLAEQLTEAHSVDALADLYAAHMAAVWRKEAIQDASIVDQLHLRLFELEGLTADDPHSKDKLAGVMTNFLTLVGTKMVNKYGIDQAIIEQIMKEQPQNSTDI